ncbi:hypothetical protein GSH05_29895 [Burkholderia pseudomallei]|uniref:Uncharacterized protein n=3 Tax=pseudomallei group TaxID=111527 RepID=A0AAX1X7A7_BURML|nr:hypothetical protein BMA0031 [Burkholderia mallei ATCC 23344]AUG22309.1 hypothetical protein CXQ84_18425 [Burkholderia pseudomallei]PNX04832.1 hypothetical protein CF649_06655 [Burkholderia sp. 136(2017)]PNX16070.1 hypothetical protein CF650_08105 [Burkholderia sp. 129]PNX31623.1 hypothetical protein CF647_06560 [Burkholderia sp. 117]PNX40534.1 hypothetical protein CF648_06650 [Burkholderia sp. 137]RKN99376.1 hypothetical protein D8O31_10175 [Burkholderia mallei]
MMCAWARRIERGLRRQRAARVARLRAVIAWRPLSEQARAPYVRKRTLRKDRRGGSCAPHTSAARRTRRPARHAHGTLSNRTARGPLVSLRP